MERGEKREKRGENREERGERREERRPVHFTAAPVNGKMIAPNFSIYLALKLYDGRGK